MAIQYRLKVVPDVIRNRLLSKKLFLASGPFSSAAIVDQGFGSFKKASARPEISRRVFEA
jgi:hypothetical protein